MRATGPFRVAGGSALDRDQPLRFQFDGKTLAGLAGDTLASALLANGIRTIGRSFKFHRPRGVYSCGIEEPNALVQLESGAITVPSERSTVLELYEGLEASSAAGWPSVRWDLGRVLDFTAPLWAAGFYNKTFMWPSWDTYEGGVRRMAGFGRVPLDPDPRRYESRNLHCDTLVVGGGVAGLQAATTAAKAGGRVVLVETSAELGGRAAWDGSEIDGTSGSLWSHNAAERLGSFEAVRILTRTTAVGIYGRGVVTLLERMPMDAVQQGAPRERYWVVRAEHVVLASGAIEQPLIFCNNDRPGIMFAGAAHEYLRRYAVAVGRRVVIATNNDSAYPLARDLKEAGVIVLGVADSRHEVPQTWVDELGSRNIPLLKGSMPIDTRGFGALSSVSIGRLSSDATAIESVELYACDALAISGGWNPTLHLYSQAGGRVAYDEQSAALAPAGDYPGATLAGRAAGVIEGSSGSSPSMPGPRISRLGKTSRQWVDLRHDVTVADLELAIRENHGSIEHVKRYSTVGMAADQGKTSNLAALEIVARLRGMNPSDLGHTTFRPPFVPVTLGAIAGRSIGERFLPARRTPMHAWHEANAAVLEDFGKWKRPAVYLRPGESRDAGIQREARAVRDAAGLFDASSLGKIEVQGPDALSFLDRFYINNLTTLKPGRARYGLMLRETGVIFDDGTVVMLAPDRFLITTTSGNADCVAEWLEAWRQCEWPESRVVITPVTEQWATVSLAGPRARHILSTLDTDIDFSNEAFPHLGMRVGRLLGYATRVYRVSFTGELTYEINVPANAGQALWDTLLIAGKPHELQPFGLEALMLMRLEKGFLHVGTDTDGTTVPDDVGWGKVAANKQADFIGKRSLVLPDNLRSDRMQLVGLTADTDVIVGSHLRLAGSEEATDGWVTSAGRAVLTGEAIALAVLRGGGQQIGAEVSVHHMGHVTDARVVNPPFFDSEGERMNA